MRYLNICIQFGHCLPVFSATFCGLGFLDLLRGRKGQIFLNKKTKDSLTKIHNTVIYDKIQYAYIENVQK